MTESDEGQYTIVEERLLPEQNGDGTWVVTWKSIKDDSEIRRRMSDQEYVASVAGPREEKPLWRRTQIDPIGELDRE